MRSLLITLLQIYCLVWRWKSLENLSAFSRSYSQEIWHLFDWQIAPPCRKLSLL